MKLYVTHSSGYDYQTELYEPLKQLLSSDHTITFPHGPINSEVKSKDIIPTYDAILAEVSYLSTGQGIELGWADANNVRIICFYKRGSKISHSLQFICNTFIEYTSKDEMIEKLQLEINRLART